MPLCLLLASLAECVIDKTKAIWVFAQDWMCIEDTGPHLLCHCRILDLDRTEATTNCNNVGVVLQQLRCTCTHSITDMLQQLVVLLCCTNPALAAMLTRSRSCCLWGQRWFLVLGNACTIKASRD